MFKLKVLLLRFCQLCAIAFPFVLNVVFYRTGSMDDLVLFLPVFVGLTLLNNSFCNKTLNFVLMQGFMLLCIILSCQISTNIYFENISSDPMTPVIGELFLYLESGILIIVTSIIAWNKSKHESKKT